MKTDVDKLGSKLEGWVAIRGYFRSSPISTKFTGGIPQTKYDHDMQMILQCRAPPIRKCPQNCFFYMSRIGKTNKPVFTQSYNTYSDFIDIFQTSTTLFKKEVLQFMQERMSQR